MSTEAPEKDGIGQESEPLPPAAEQQPEAGDDWTSNLDDETRELVKNKGWKSPVDMAKSYQEAERNQSRERERAASAERQAQELVKLYEQGTRQITGQRPQDDDPYQIGQLGDLVEAGEVSFKDAFRYMTEQVFPDIARAQAGHVIQPVAVSTAERELRETAVTLEDTYGDVFREMAPEVMDLMRRDPEEYNQSSRGMRRAFAMVKAERDAKAAREAARAAKAETIDSSSVGNRSTADAASIIRDMISQADPPRNDGI
jgi:hypothetical protein